MATEIFLSYRRSDATGNARLLYEKLCVRFEASRIFFDLATLEAGDVFPEEIDRAVRECCVLLALIGPGWVDAEVAGLRRLHDAKDFVRREIALALELGKHVIPVLLENALMPDICDLPAVLAKLPGRNMHRQGGTRVEYDASLDQLVGKLARINGVSAPRPPTVGLSAAVLVQSHKLPLLCDRSPQDHATRDMISTEMLRERRRPIVLVLHGPPEEEHHAFVERLEDFSLPRFLKGTSFQSGVRFARINEALPVGSSQADFDRRLRQHLGDALESSQVTDDTTVLREMQAQRISVLFAVITWHASECADYPDVLLQRVFSYWSRFADQEPRTLVGCIVCLKYDREASSLSWINRILGTRTGRVQALRMAVACSGEMYAAREDVSWRVSDELAPVTVADLERWVSEVAQRTGRFRVPQSRLQAIIGGKSRPMQPVLIELDKLMPIY